jgi:outer membrane protein OmpA-like peptidoglycan-associated protein
MEETVEMQGQQELQALLISESEDKIFTYYPASEQTIHSGSYGVFDDVIAYLNENPTAKVNIRAYTDSSADLSRNLALSKKRVFEIRNYLILRGISEERILAQGLGENNFLEIVSGELQVSQVPPVDMVIR